jgi:hypothetical protein
MHMRWTISALHVSNGGTGKDLAVFVSECMYSSFSDRQAELCSSCSLQY